MNSATSHQKPFNVVTAGGGVAALEAALALRELGGERIATTMLAPNLEFVYRPMTVQEPFGYAEARRYPLGRQVDAEHNRGEEGKRAGTHARTV